MSVEVHIGKIEISGVTITAPTGVEDLRDLGHFVPSDMPETSVAESVTEIHPEEERAHIVRPHLRRHYLDKVTEYAGKKRKMQGADRAVDAPSIKDPEAIKNAHEGYSEKLGSLLAEACISCEFHGACRLEGKPEAWLRRHPTTRKQIKNRLQEAIPDFVERLDLDPMAHCVPPGKER